MEPWERELEEIAEIEFDVMQEIMEEPPGGHNHGRARTLSGGWHILETPGKDSPSYKHYIEKPRKHGTAYTYMKLRCRCEACRAWMRDYRKRGANP